MILCKKQMKFFSFLFLPCFLKTILAVWYVTVQTFVSYVCHTTHAIFMHMYMQVNMHILKYKILVLLFNLNLRNISKWVHIDRPRYF